MSFVTRIIEQRLIPVAVVAVLFLFALNINAATFTAQATGNWNNASTWTFTGSDADGIPDSDDDVTIDGAYTVTLTQNEACNSLTISTSTSAYLDLAGFTLTVGTTVSVTNGSLDLNAGTLTVSSDLTIGTSGILVAGSTSNINLGGNLSVDGTWPTAITVNITFNGASDQSISGTTDIKTRGFTINKSGGTLSNTMSSVTFYQLALQSGTFAPSNTFINVTPENGTQLTFNKTGGTFSPQSGNIFEFQLNDDAFSGNPQTVQISSNSSIAFESIKINSDNPNNVLEFQGSVTYTINSQLEQSNSGALITLTSATLAYGAGATLLYTCSSRTIDIDEWPATNGPTTVDINTTGTITFASGVSRSTDYLVLDGSGGTFNINNASATVTVNTQLTRTNGVITVTSGSLAYGTSSTLLYNGSSAQTTGDEWTSSLTPPNVTINNASGVTISGTGTAGDRTVSGDLTLTSGELKHSEAGRTLTVNGDIVGGAGSYGITTRGTMVLNGSSSTNITISESFTVGNLTINKASSSVSVTVLSGGVLKLDKGSSTDNSAFNIATGTFIFSESTQLNLQGTSTGTHDLTIGASGILYTGGVNIANFDNYTLDAASEIHFNGTANSENIPAGISYGDVFIDKSSQTAIMESGTLTFQTGTTITVSSGILQCNGATLSLAGTNTLSVANGAKLETNGTSISGFSSYSLNGTVEFNGSSAETTPASVTFADFILNNASNVSLGGANTVTGTLTFTSGKLISTSSNLLTLGATATATPTTTSFVRGPVARQTDGSVTSFVFPVGNVDNLRTVTLDFGASAPTTGNTITVEANGASSSPTSTLSNIKSVEDDGYWTISTTLSSIPAYTATFKTTGFSPQITSSSNVTMVRGTDPTYNDEAGSSPSTATDQVTATFASATSFGDYAVGNLTGTYTWDGGAGDGLWSSAANWVGDQVPQTGDIVVFDNSALSGNYSVTYDASVTQTEFQSVSVSPSGGSTITLTLTKNATMNLTASSSALVVGSGGTLVFNGSSVIMGGSAYDATLTDYQSGSTVQYNALVNSNVQSDTYYNLTVNLGTAGQSNGAITVNNNFVNQGSATFTAGGNITVSGTFNNSGTFETPSGQTYTLSVTGNATNSGTVTLSSSGTATFSGDVTLSSGTFTPNADTHVKGNITGSGGSFSTSTGTIILDGTAAQTISGAADISFYNLQVNNSNGISLSQNPTVEGTLTFTSGLITTGSNYITIGTNGSTSGGSSSSYVSGRMRKAFVGNAAGSFTFDTGKGGEYLPVSITFTDVSADYTVAVEQYNSDPHSDIGNAIDAGTLSAISTVRYWLVDGTGGTPTNPQVTLTWNSNDKVSNLTALDVAQWTGTQWISAGGDGVGDANSGTIQSDALTSTGNYFTFGDDAANGQDNSLPVELASFTANADYGKVVLTWTTQSELNNQGFNIYRRMSNVPEGWQKINSEMIAGQGNASYESNYSFTDKQVAAGRTYEYMLESVSFSGLKVQEKTIQVTIPVPQEFALLNNYPNPFNPTTNLKFRLPENHKVTLSIYDLQGRVIKHLLNSVSYPAGEHVVSWDATDDFGNRAASGVYLYVFQAGKFKKVGKMTLLK